MACVTAQNSGALAAGEVKKGKKRLGGAERKRRQRARESAGVGAPATVAHGSAVDPANGAALRGGPGVSLKRGRGDRSSEGSTPRQIKKASEGVPSYSRVTASELKLAVVPELYPEERLSVEQGRAIVDALEKAIDGISEGEIPCFRDNWLLRGAQVFHCDSQAAKDWLLCRAPEWVPWEGAKLRVVEQSALQKAERVTVYVRGTHAPDVILRRLGMQNKSLHVQEWRTVQAWQAKDENRGEVETAVRVLMEASEVEALRVLGFRPFCGASKAHVVHHAKKATEEGEAAGPDPPRADGGGGPA